MVETSISCSAEAKLSSRSTFVDGQEKTTSCIEGNASTLASLSVLKASLAPLIAAYLLVCIFDKCELLHWFKYLLISTGADLRAVNHLLISTGAGLRAVNHLLISTGADLRAVNLNPLTAI